MTRDHVAGLLFVVAIGIPGCWQSAAPSRLEDCSVLGIGITRLDRPQFEGVDILLVVDNSSSMAEEQSVLATSVFTQVSALTHPLSPYVDPEWGFPPLENVRVAVTTSDMGRQFGYGRIADDSTFPGRCSARGDDGAFLARAGSVTAVEIGDNLIKCEPDGGQCPTGFTCENNLCASGESTVVTCGPDAEGDWIGTGVTEPNADLATQVACRALQGTQGCNIPQPLEAAVRALETHPEFMAPTHLLAIFIISDGDDCSIEDGRIFETPEWLSATESDGGLDVACHHPVANDAFLFEPADYYERFVALKDGRAERVLFAAIAGVPNRETSPCQGTGDEVEAGQCLQHEGMQQRLDTFTSINGATYQDFAPACTGTREEMVVSNGRPPRRLVEVAQAFRSNGYVYSICNEDWGPAVRIIAEILPRSLRGSCYPVALPWSLLPKTERASLGCDDCGVAEPDVVVEVTRTGDASVDESCPSELYESVSAAARADYESRKSVFAYRRDEDVIGKVIVCPVPKLATPRECDAARRWITDHYLDSVGWYYCERDGENYNGACRDDIDNDGVDGTDCDDPKCSDCEVCNGTGVACERGCHYEVELTARAKNIVVNYETNIQGSYQTELDAAECRATPRSSLGATCTQPGYELEEGRYILSRGPARISFQKGCSCLTYAEGYSYPDGNPFHHFCTRPCTGDCPDNFTCEEIFNSALDLPDGVSRSYCVPTCLVEHCRQGKLDDTGEWFNQQCLPSSETTRDWQCRWPG